MSTDSQFPRFPQPDPGVPPPRAAHGAAQSTVKPAGIVLIVISALSVAGNVVSLATVGLMERFFAEIGSQNPEMKDLLAFQTGPLMIGLTLVCALLSTVSLVGGICMVKLRGYGLAMTGAILSIVNLMGGCCCLLNIAAGVWALIVLLREDVQAAFRRG